MSVFGFVGTVVKIPYVFVACAGRERIIPLRTAFNRKKEGAFVGGYIQAKASFRTGTYFSDGFCM